MRPRKLSEGALADIARVAAARLSLPSDLELAHRHGVSLSAVQKAMIRWRQKIQLKMSERSVSRETAFISTDINQLPQNSGELVCHRFVE